jgi:hypothetical protein
VIHLYLLNYQIIYFLYLLIIYFNVVKLPYNILETYPVHMGSSCIYCAHELTKFMKKSKKIIYVLFILLYLCIKIKV